MATNDENQRQLLGQTLHAIAEPNCCYCHCSGDSCRTETGEKCELVTVTIVRKRCTGVACIFAEAAYQRSKKRKNRAPRKIRRRSA